MPRSVNLNFPIHLQNVLLPFVAGAIQYAHSCSPSKWGLTPYEIGLRLNVGFIEVLTTMPDHLRLIIDANALEDKGLEEIQLFTRENRDYYYVPVKTSLLAELSYEPFDKFCQQLALLMEAHFSLIALAAKGGFNLGSKTGHSSKAVLHLVQFLNIELPLPTYAIDIEENLQISSGVLKETFVEGALRRILSNEYERNPRARQKCLEIHGYKCAVCKFSFEETYGELGREFIHVHHLNPISARDSEYVIDPEKDLRPVCPNCHAMIHRTEPPLTIEKLGARMLEQKSSVEL